jgi:hypothetical protein
MGFKQTQQQYELESERLLTEFRAQKQISEQLRQENDKLSSRLSESEKLVARLQNGSSLDRLTNNPIIPAYERPFSQENDPSSLGSSFPGQTVSSLNSLPRPSTSNSKTGPIKWRPIGQN